MATRTIANGGGNWSANGTWVEGVAPTASDSVVATATSGAVTVDTATCVAASVNLTNYTGLMTITSGQTLTVSGNITLVAGMTTAGTGTLAVNATTTINSGGLSLPWNFSISATSAVTVTLASNWSITGQFSQTSASFTQNLSGAFTFTVAGGLNITTGVNGTATLIATGGTITATNSGNGIACNLTLNGNVTFGATVYFKTGTLTYQSGAITVTGATLNISGNCTLNTSGMAWNIFRFTAAATVTLSSNLSVSLLNFTAASGTFAGNYDVSCSTLYCNGNTSTFASGRTLNVSTAICIGGFSSTPSVNASTIKSSTASSAFYLNYQGNQTNCNMMGVVFTDVDASSSAIKLYNYQGGVLTRTVNIQNIVLPLNAFNPVNGCSIIKGVSI